MTEKVLTKNEELVLFGLSKFPNDNDKEISEKLGMVESTFTTIKNKLSEQGFFQPYFVPMVNKIGCELMGIIFSNFNLVIPLEQRINITKRTIEISDEIFLSIGEPEKGFSVSLSKNYTDFARINENRIETFGRIGLLEDEFPHEMIFPFEISHIINFFNFAQLLQVMFSIEGFEDKEDKEEWFKGDPIPNLTDNEKKVLIAIIENPETTTQEIGDSAGISRQSAAKLKNKFIEEYKLIRRIIVPNLKKIGFKIFTFYSFRFNPEKPPNEKDIKFLNTSSSMIFIYRRFEIVIVSVYKDYNAYKEDKMLKFRYLKEKNLIAHNPIVRKFEYDRIEVIKNFSFAPITKKILKLD